LDRFGGAGNAALWALGEMMSKQICIRFERGDRVWEKLLEVADKKDRQEEGETVFGAIEVMHYELKDQQFVAATLHAHDWKEIGVLIPRDIVVKAIEAKGDLGKLGLDFAGGPAAPAKRGH
jgi:hypothetical protein